MSLHIDRSGPDQMKVRFVWSGPAATAPISVVGTFNDWQAGLDELQSDANGERSVTIGLPYGHGFVFRYLDSAGQWFDEPDADEITTHGSVLKPRTPGTA